MRRTLFIGVIVFFSLSQCLSPGPGVVSIFYNNQRNWNKVNIYYNAGSGWTPLPGIGMVASTNSSLPNPPWWFQNVAGNTLTFVFNDGNGNWDNNNGHNYQVLNPGLYSVANSQITTFQTFSKACPGNPPCSGNGQCDNALYSCICDSGFFGLDCSGECPGGHQKPCNGHGTCDDGASGSGACTCENPYGNCGQTNDCSINFSNDTNNCGGCAKLCTVGPNILSATCSNSTCNVVCDSGYTLCYGACISGDHCSRPPLPGCEIFNNNQCNGNVIITDPSYNTSRWWTPWPGDADYLSSYQDYYRLVGNAHVQYSSDLKSAVVTINALHKNDSGVTLTYQFGSNSPSNNPSMFFTAPGGNNSISGSLQTAVFGSDGSKLVLPLLDFVWNNPVIDRTDGDFRDGQKGAIIELFGWPHQEVEAECEAISKMGYLGLKLFPAQEQLISWQPFQQLMNPWYFMYQPVSYKMDGRMGTRADLRNLIQTCRALGVRVYADAVVNHMTGSGNDANPNHRFDSGSCTTWPNKTTSSPQPSPFYTQGFTYTYNSHTDAAPLQEFPGVPYGPLDFHCERPLNSWTDPLDLNAGWLTGLVDLNTETTYVQERIADYMTDLLGLGFSGFRIDAAKHIQPDDLIAIFSKLRRNMGGQLPADFVTWWEVLLGGESDMLMCNTNSGYNYAQYVSNGFAAAGWTQADIQKIKIWNSGYPKEPGSNCGMVPNSRQAVQNDDADQQNLGSTSRDMGDQGTVLVIDKNVALHRSFEVKLFTNPNGAVDNDNDYPIRLLLSSFYFPENQARGIPDGLSDCSLCTTTCEGCQTVTFVKAQNSSSCGYDQTSSGQYNMYTRTHRDRTIIMAMRQWMKLPTNVTNEQIGLPANCT